MIPLSPIFRSAEETSLDTKKDQVDPNNAFKSGVLGQNKKVGKVLRLAKRLFLTKRFVYLCLFNLQCSFSIRKNIHSSTLFLC